MRNSDYKARRSQLAVDLADRKVDGFVVSSGPNIHYLSGFTGSNGLLLLLAERGILFTDPRYELQAPTETDCTVKVARGPLIGALAHLARRKRIRRLGFERSRMLFETYEALEGQLGRGGTLEPVAGAVEGLRMVKSATEVERIRIAMKTCSDAFARTIRRARAGVREHELAAELDYQMRRLGAEKAAFDTIVASGARSALPHAQPTTKALDRNELVLIDAGAQREGYASDMTRMLFLGRPARRVRQLHKAVLEAQQSALAAVREGVTAGSVDRTARRVLRAHKLDSFFVHSTGHGLGLEIHEAPRIGKAEKTRLRAGMVITVEPGVYMEGFGGIRIEDTVLVKKTGCEVLTPTSKELVVL